jgi:hypothetical protein
LYIYYYYHCYYYCATTAVKIFKCDKDKDLYIYYHCYYYCYHHCYYYCCCYHYYYYYYYYYYCATTAVKIFKCDKEKSNPVIQSGPKGSTIQNEKDFEILMRWAGHVARMEEGRGVYRVLVGKRVGKRPLGRPKRRWEDHIKIDL